MKTLANSKPLCDFEGLVYGPQEAADLSISLVEEVERTRGQGIQFGVKRLDDVMNPLRPGQLISVYGLPGHHKSGVMNWLSKRALQLIGPEEDKIVARVTWEQSVEEDTLAWLAGDSKIPVSQMVRGELNGAEWEMLRNSSARRAACPMWIIGHSLIESQKRRKARPRMTMSDVALALEYICEDVTDRKLAPSLVVLDYLQRIRPDPKDGGDRREQVMEMVNRAKDAAISFGCPVLLGVQAKREVEDRQYKMPRQNDAQESSNVEQTSDKVITLWYPHKTEEPGSIVGTMRTKGKARVKEEWEVNPNLLLVGLPKQKMGGTLDAVPVFVDPARGNFSEMTYPQGSN